MPKLLQINVTVNWGSTGKIAEQIGLHAMSCGWDSYIAYGRMMNSSKSKLIKIGSKFDVYEHYIENRFLDNEGLASRQATKNFLKIVDNLKPDIVQLHNIHDHYLNYQLLFEYLNKTGIKVVWTFHDCWAFTGHCFHFIAKKCERWKAQCYDCLLKNEYPKTLLDRSRKHFELKKHLFTNCNNITIVPVSYWMGKFVKESFFKEKQIKVIHNGIDLQTFKPCGTHLSQEDDIFRIIAVSNIWCRDKGEFDIYKLRKMLPEEKYEIIMVGLTDGQVKRLPLGIKGFKRTQNVEELVSLYSKANVLINPTYADTFPTVNIEALACGTPVITYHTGGSPEAVDEKTGIVVEQGDVKALVDAICKMEKSPLSSEDCRQRAEKLFDKDKCFGQYIQLYDSLL